MAKRTDVVLLCDSCGTETEVETHQVTVDGQAVEVETCPRHWAPIEKAVSRILEIGRRPRKK